MTNAELDLSQSPEISSGRSRAKTYILIRLAFDLLLLPILFLEVPEGGLFPSYWLIIVDLLGLLLYWLAVKRWPNASTYLALIFAALIIIAFDFSRGEVTFTSWMFLIPLSLAGGLIVTRPGFNSLVTLSILAIFGIYLAMIYLARVPLTLSLPADQFYNLAAALGVVLLILNALVESLVVYLYQTQDAFIKNRVHYLQVLNELDQSRRALSDTQRQVRRVERMSTTGRLAGQLSTSLRGPLETLEKALGQPEKELCKPENLDALRTEVQTALRMTDGLQHFASLGQPHMQTVNLDDLLADELAHIQIPRKVSLVIHQPPVFPPIQADRQQIGLLMHHIIDNALQAVQDGGTVTITLEPRPEGVRFSVSDTGPGIPEDELDLIFEPLYTTQQQSFGLGLAICQQVTQAHGGKITVESEVGKGTTVTVTLPRVPRHPPEELAQDVAG